MSSPLAADERIRLLEQLASQQADRIRILEALARDLANPPAELVAAPVAEQVMAVRALVARARELMGGTPPTERRVTDSARRDHADREGWPRP